MFLGYFDALVKILHNNILFGNDITQGYKLTICNQLADTLQEELLKCIPSLDKTKAIEELISFRLQFCLEQSTELEIARRQSWLASTESASLMSSFLSNLDFTIKPSIGRLKFTVKKTALEELRVELKSVSELKHPNSDELFNFSITISVLPLPILSNKYKDKHQTKVHSNTSGFHIFDLNLENGVNNDGSDIAILTSNHNTRHNQFLQFVLYHHFKVSKSVKVFKGIFLFPVRDITENEQIISANVHAYPDIIPSWDILHELNNRGGISSKFVKDIQKYFYEKRLLTRKIFIKEKICQYFENFHTRRCT